MGKLDKRFYEDLELRAKLMAAQDKAKAAYWLAMAAKARKAAKEAAG